VNDRASECPHTHFEADVSVHRLTDEASGIVSNFIAEMSVRCTDCCEQFHFIGADAGHSFVRPTVNVGATTLHAPIAPGVAPMPARLQYEAPPRSFE